MKHSKRIISLLLAVMMLLTVAAIPVFAKSRTKTYTEMTVLGDSVATGFCMVLPDGSMVGKGTHGTRIEGSYPDLVAKELGIETYHNYAREALGTNEFRNLLYPNYAPLLQEDAEHSKDLISFYAEGLDRWAEQQQEVVEDLKSSDLIIVNIGSNDIFAYALSRVTNAMAGTYTTNKDAVRRKALQQLNTKVNELLAEGNLETAWAQFFATVEQLDILEATVSVLAKNIYNGTCYFLQNWAPIMKKIHSINPKATVLAVSLFNGLNGLYLTDNFTAVDLGKVVLGPSINIMNSCIKNFNAKYHYYKYVDITQVPHPQWAAAMDLNMESLTWDLMVNTHPSNEGHVYIKNQIMNVLF